MGKKKKPPSPKVHNTRSTKKEEAVVIKEQVQSWWDKLISGNSEVSERVDKNDERKSEEPEVCGLNKSTSTVPTVSTVEVLTGKEENSEFVSSEKMASLNIETSGSSSSVDGDKSMNSSPSIMKKPGENITKSAKVVSLYDVMSYSERNIPIPGDSVSPMSKVSSPMTPLPVGVSAEGKSEYEIWMMRSAQSKKAAIITSEKLSGLEFGNDNCLRENDVTSAGKVGECRKAAAVADSLKNPNDSCPLDDATKGQMEGSMVGPNHAAAEEITSKYDKDPNFSQPLDGELDQWSGMNGSNVVGPAVVLDGQTECCEMGPKQEKNSKIANDVKMGPAEDYFDTGLNDVSPKEISPGMYKVNCDNISPVVSSPVADAPLATTVGTEEVGLQNKLSDGNTIGPAVQAKAQKKVTFADIVLGPAQKMTSSHVIKFGDFDSVLQLKNDILEVDPIRGTKYWNQELFQKLLRGDDVIDGETRLAYVGPSRNAEGIFEVNIEGHFMKKSYASNVFQLYGNFIGAVMPFHVVKENLIKMWHKYGLKSINMNRNGYFFFKFDHEEGMMQVLERNPWLVDNVPLVLQIWDPSVVLSKPSPKTVPIWVTIKDLPLSLWNGGNIGQVVSCVGKPLMLDQATFKRCETKEGPLNFARVLVDANASSGLPDKVKINLPKCGEVPGKSYFLNLSYKWKPPSCSMCEVFGHLDEKCPNNVHSGMKDQNLVKKVMISKEVKAQNDEFIEVTKKPRAKNKGKAPIWQPITKTGLVISEPGPSCQSGLNNSQVRHAILGSNMVNSQKKPSDKAAGLHNNAEVGLADAGLVDCPPLKAVGSMVTSSLLLNNSSMYDQLLKHDGPILEDAMGQTMKSKGSGFFDVSKQDFGLGPSQTVNTKNSFGSLRDEEECFDTDLGLWENEIEVVKKFVDSKTRPKMEDYDSWSGSMKKYYDHLTKMNEDDEVASETDEMARFMKSGIKS